MAADLEKTLMEQAEALEKALLAVPQYKKLQIVRKALQDLKAINGSSPATGKRVSSPMINPGLFRSIYPASHAAYRQAGSVPQAVAFAIEDAGHPLSTAEIFETLSRYGKSVGGKFPLKNLSSVLSGHGRFVSVPWRGSTAWWFNGKELPATD